MISETLIKLCVFVVDNNWRMRTFRILLAILISIFLYGSFAVGSVSAEAAPAVVEPAAPKDAAVSTGVTDTPSSSVPAPSSSPQALPKVEEASIHDSALTEGEITDSSKTKFETKKFAQVDESSGSLQYELPLTVPPGRNGVEPHLSLSYSSKPEYEAGVVGYGWSLSIPYISRVNKRGVDHMYSGDAYFTSSLSGELVAAASSSGMYTSKVETGDFISYTFSDNSWTATDKQGMIYIFGRSEDGREDKPGEPSKIYRWMLEEIRDVQGNYVKYEYDKDTDYGQVYPRRIVYTGNGTKDGIFEVAFSRESNQDYATTSAPGFQVETRWRIHDITSKVNGVKVHNYALAYKNPATRTRALLSSVTESGWDDNGVVTELAPYTFNYQDSDTPGWARDKDIVLPEPTLGDYPYLGTVFAELNGDGLPDLIRSYKDEKSKPVETISKVYLGNGHGWSLDTSGVWVLPAGPYFSENGDDMGYRVVDVNGDGRDDILESQGTHRKAYINNGHGWTDTSAWYPPVLFANAARHDNGVRLADLNGDGLTDILIANPTDGAKTYLNTGNGWTLEPTAWQPPANFTDSHFRDLGFSVVDVNNDGLPDLLRSFYSFDAGYITRQYINNGKDWNTYTSIPVLPSSVAFADNFRDQGYRTVDVNGDQQTDILQYMAEGTDVHKGAYINTGPRWEDGQIDWTSPMNFVDRTDGWKDQGVRFIDINGDGMIDLISRDSGGTTAYLNRSKKVDVLTKITYPTGGSTSIEYATAQQYKDASGKLLNNVPFPIVTVAKVTHDDARGGSSAWKYTYQDGKFYFGNPFEKKFAGFGQVTRTAPTGDTVTTYYYNAFSSPAMEKLGQYKDHVSKAGKPYRTEIRNAAGELYSATISTWDALPLGNDAYFVKLLKTLTSTYDGNTDHKDSAESFVYDSVGNLIEKTEWGEVNGANDGSFTDSGTDKITTAVAYASSTIARVFVPQQETLKDQLGTKFKESRFYYDALPLGSVSKGNLTKTEQWKKGDEYVTSEKSYNSFGLVISEKDPRNNITTYTYDASNLYPTTILHPLSQKTLYEYDYSSGKPVKIIDANNVSRQTVYDGLDRVIAEKQPDLSSPSTLVTKTAIHYIDNAPLTSVWKTDYLTAASSTDTYLYYDGLGRRIQTRAQSELPTRYMVKDTIYNSLGLVMKESLPYFSSGSSLTVPTSETHLYTSYEYDPVYRVKRSIDALGTTVNRYDQWKASMVDPLGKVKDIQKDAFGRVISVTDHIGTSLVSYIYQYNNLGKITKISEPGGALRTITYDGLGERLNAEDLHYPDDISFGVWDYGYDDSGNLISRRDPKGQVVAYSYDNLNRILSEDYAGKVGIETSYSYDTCPGGIGKLCAAVSLGGVATSYAYNPLGLVAKEIKKLSDSSLYTTEFSYDRQGNITSLTYPDRSIVTYVYNKAGLLDAVGSYVTNIDYSPLGQISHINYGNTASTTNEYDAAKLYELVSKTTSFATSTLQKLTYTYDAVGNITKIVDASPGLTGKTVEYIYDDVSRLVSASTTKAVRGGDYLQKFSYDLGGNILAQSNLGAYTYYTSADTQSYANPHAVKNVGGVAYTYDNNGNVVSENPSTSFVWDYDNRLTSAVINGSASNYTYDHESNRVKVLAKGITTYYPNKYYDEVSSGTSTKYVYAGDMLVASVQAKLLPTASPKPSPSPSAAPLPGLASPASSQVTVLYHHPDHLTSASLITTSAGKVFEQSDYYPYGSIRTDEASSTKEKHKFTGHITDTETNLVYMGSRYYDPKIGRFLSQDPEFWSLRSDYILDPQQWNSYSYSRNNPIGNVDPDGKKVYAVAKEIEGNSLGTHIFLMIIPDNPKDFNMKAGEGWTLGGYAGEHGNLIKARNAPSDVSVIQHGYSIPEQKLGALKKVAEVGAPSGASDTEFIKNITTQFDGYKDDAKYDPFVGNGYNSNNFATMLLKNAGVQKLPWNGNAPGIDPGYGRSIPSDYIKADGNSAVPEGTARTLSVLGGYESREVGINATGFIQGTGATITANITRIANMVKKK